MLDDHESMSYLSKAFRLATHEGYIPKHRRGFTYAIHLKFPSAGSIDLHSYVPADDTTSLSGASIVGIMASQGRIAPLLTTAALLHSSDFGVDGLTTGYMDDRIGDPVYYWVPLGLPPDAGPRREGSSSNCGEAGNTQSRGIDLKSSPPLRQLAHLSGEVGEEAASLHARDRAQRQHADPHGFLHAERRRRRQKLARLQMAAVALKLQERMQAQVLARILLRVVHELRLNVASSGAPVRPSRRTSAHTWRPSRSRNWSPARQSSTKGTSSGVTPEGTADETRRRRPARRYAADANRGRDRRPACAGRRVELDEAVGPAGSGSRATLASTLGEHPLRIVSCRAGEGYMFEVHDGSPWHVRLESLPFRWFIPLITIKRRNQLPGIIIRGSPMPYPRMVRLRQKFPRPRVEEHSHNHPA